MRKRDDKIMLLMAASLLLLSFTICGCQALQLSMMASSSSSRRRTIPRPPSPSLLIIPPIITPEDISSALISQLAIVAIQSRLKEHDGVACDVAFSSSDLLLRGRVGPVTVSGKRWRSGLGLTCRALDATVQQCQLDSARILSHRKLVLTTPALGKAMVALNALDFGNFITHPLMRPPAVTTATTMMDADSSERHQHELEFVKSGTLIDAAAGTVVFSANYADSRYRCVLSRSKDGQKAVVRVTTTEDATTESDDDDDDGTTAADAVVAVVEKQLSSMLERFFNEMVFELDGTYLSFRSMMVTDKGDAPSVMLALNIKVRKLPSPGLDF